MRQMGHWGSEAMLTAHCALPHWPTASLPHYDSYFVSVMLNGPNDVPFAYV